MTIQEFYANYSKIMQLKANVYFNKVPVLRSFTDDLNILKSDTVLKIKEIIHDKSKILDIGAGSKNFKKLLDSIGINCTYKSMDIDKHYHHDYHSIEEISEKFDYVILFNILEHLPFETGLAYLTKAQEILENNGMLVISVPNVWHPNHMMRCDITHIKAYPYQDLFALLKFMGFQKIDIYRIYPRPYHFSLTQYFVNKLKIFLYLIMELDYTKDLWIICKKHKLLRH